MNIPPGVDTGEKLRMVGRGHAAPEGHGRSGDLYITLQVQPPGPSESIFQRKGSDVTVEVRNECSRRRKFLNLNLVLRR